MSGVLCWSSQRAFSLLAGRALGELSGSDLGTLINYMFLRSSDVVLKEFCKSSYRAVFRSPMLAALKFKFELVPARIKTKAGGNVVELERVCNLG